MKLSALSLALALALTGAPSALSPSFAQVRLPSLGESVSEDVGVGAEKKLGDEIMRQVRRDVDYIDDPLLLDYVQSVWTRLVAAARERGDIGADTDGVFAWEAFLVRDRSFNAFALPGGYVGVHLGLIAAAGSRDELASVLGHELSHVTQRHIARSISSSSRQSLVGMAAMILGVVAASRANSGDGINAAIIGSQAAMMQGQLNFSRDMEREADRIGYQVMTTAGYSPQGMAAMFEKLENASRLNDSGNYPYLRSHPLTTERIGEARMRAQAAAQSAPAVPTPEHLVMQARARVLGDTSVGALRRIQSQSAEPERSLPPAERMAALYGSALASQQLREPQQAQASLDAARKLAGAEAPVQRALTMLQAQIWLDTGAAPRALAAIEAIEAIDDGSRPLMLMRAQASLDAARAAGMARTDPLRKGTDALQTWVADHPQDATAWSLLAQANTQQGLRLRAVRAEAEERAALGDLSGAIDRLRAGQRLARSGLPGSTDFIDASVIDARLRQIDALRRQLYADANRPPPRD
ncbi:M48 family metalloprotease [uncultured Aquincola sp.]|uniref:M48 family metalloprotease n=1 Tax=uncultured Aquincola sp. TaxID=886556 RepID=UPI0032B1D30D